MEQNYLKEFWHLYQKIECVISEVPSFFILTLILYLSIHSFYRDAKILSDNFVPLLLKVIISFCKFITISDAKPVGLDNYVAAFSYPQFPHAFL